jgi:hypothetical protein
MARAGVHRRKVPSLDVFATGVAFTSAEPSVTHLCHAGNWVQQCLEPRGQWEGKQPMQVLGTNIRSGGEASEQHCCDKQLRPSALLLAGGLCVFHAFLPWLQAKMTRFKVSNKTTNPFSPLCSRFLVHMHSQDFSRTKTGK